MFYNAGAVTGLVDADDFRVYAPIAEAERSALMAAEVQQPIVIKGTLGFVSQRLGIHPWGQILIVVLAFFGWRLYSKLGDIDQHLTKNDTALQILPLEISKELLAQVKTDIDLGHLERADRAAESAAAIITKASEKKTPADNSYFRESVDLLASMGRVVPDNSPVFGTLHKTRLLLASYRSELSSELNTEHPSVFMNSPTSSIPQSGTRLIFTIPPDREVIGVSGIEPYERNFANTDVTWSGAIVDSTNHALLTVDGIHWKDVVFVNLHIKYLGGDLDLNNVRFVNCTFDSPPTFQGEKFIEYATLRLQELHFPVRNSG